MKELKDLLMKTAKNEGYSLNAQILFILWEWVSRKEMEQRR